MKQLLILTVLTLVLTGCYGMTSNGGSKSFAQQIAELEAQPVPQDGKAGTSPSVTQSEVDRALDVAQEAQKERRAEAPLVESNYIFQVMPDKGTYSFDEYNQVVTDDPKSDDYSQTKRLWNKPKRIKPDTYAEESAPAEGEGSGDAEAAPSSDSGDSSDEEY